MIRVTYTPYLKTFIRFLGITCLIPSFDTFPFNQLSLRTPSLASPLQDPEISKKLAQQIFALLDAHRIRYDIDYHSVHLHEPVVDSPCEGKEEFIDQIFKAISAQKPLIFKLVGFPFKSVNTRQKVISSQPDMAERSALEHLNELCRRIQSLYAPGAQMIILTDGHIFCDVFQVSDTNVETYETTLKTLAADLPHITIQTLTDFLPTDVSYQALRDKFDHLPAPEIDQKSLDLMKERLSFELNDHNQPLDHLARTMIHRSYHYASFLSQQPSLAPMISLSVHFQKNIAKKLGIYLVRQSPITPWHGVFIITRDGTASIQYKKDVNDQNYQVVSQIVNGVPCAFYRHR